MGFSTDTIANSKTYYNVYTINPAPAVEVAKQIARKLAVVEQPGVAFYGNPQSKVSTVGIGTGCFSDPKDFMDLNPDLFITIDDSINTWIQTTYAEDSGHPLVVINHGTSEEFGMRTLNDHLKAIYTDYNVLHLKQGCSYKWVTG